jgi:superfamily II DNA or RNA helicase
LVNVDVLAEGYDNDQVFYLIDFRPTESDVRMLQVFGRLTRTASSKPPQEKIYIQMILPESGQNILEEVLKKEGVENIQVMGKTREKTKVERKKRKEIDAQKNTFEKNKKIKENTPEEKQNIDQINKAAGKENKKKDNNAIQIVQDPNKDVSISSSSQDAQEIDPNLLSSDMEIVRAGYTLITATQ